MSDPLALQIIDALAARLADIKTTHGYYTDAGLAVHRGQVTLTEDDALPAVTVVSGEAAVEKQQNGRILWRLPVSLAGLIACAAADPEDAGQKLLADLKRAALRAADLHPNPGPLGGLCKTLDPAGAEVTTREVGSGYVAAILDLDLTFIETYGSP